MQIITRLNGLRHRVAARNFLCAVLAVPALIAIVPTPADAFRAKVEAVIAACDRDPNCAYSGDKDGGISGCSATGCFVCSVKTRTCTDGSGKRATGSGPKGQTDPVKTAIGAAGKPSAKPPVQGLPNAAKEARTGQAPVQGLPRPQPTHQAGGSGLSNEPREKFTTGQGHGQGQGQGNRR